MGKEAEGGRQSGSEKVSTPKDGKREGREEIVERRERDKEKSDCIFNAMLHRLSLNDCQPILSEYVDKIDVDETEVRHLLNTFEDFNTMQILIKLYDNCIRDLVGEAQ